MVYEELGKHQMKFTSGAVKNLKNPHKVRGTDGRGVYMFRVWLPQQSVFLKRKCEDPAFQWQVMLQVNPLCENYRLYKHRLELE